VSSCCQSPRDYSATSAFFDRWSAKYAKPFRKGKLDRIQGYLLHGISRHSVEHASILDIGCGAGQIHLTLLKQGAARSLGVDLSNAMLDQARGFAARDGLLDRARYVKGDFTQLADSIEDTDITVLDKVVCCYENLDDLVLKSIGKTTGLLALTHPQENLLNETLFKGHKALARLLKWDFHPFWHDWSAMKEMVCRQGFALRYERSTILWHALVFERIR